ncbi:MAG TPA: isocitrate lyase/phosphoenolpyruvate mutase family protein [Longimicrobium sp.]|nr:isocitrate lyase/phosphoenolpyruvate mutase family protein [Longimicrobium sp.]
MNQSDRAARFRALHEQRPLVLPNAWDAASARVIELAGAQAIATTSAGVSWALGRPDGEGLRQDEMLGAVASIVRAVSVPVTADVESGYGGGSPEDVADTVRALVGLGVAGINLEDTPGADGNVLMPAEVHAMRIRAARDAAKAAGGDIVINARTDVYLFAVGASETRFDETVRRGRIYRDAGADCVFVPGVIDADTIAALVRAIGGAINVMAMPGAPSVSRLGELGVARVSVGPAIAEVALAATRRAARELLEQGTYLSLGEGMPFPEANGMFARTAAPT